MPATLSVVIPNYNHARYLERCLTAVMTQERLPDEVLVYDDASTDNSLEVLERLQERWPLVRIIRGERNRGPLQACNTLARQARGDWLHSLAADDVPLPGFYRLGMQQATAYPHAGCIFGSFIGVEEESGARWMESADRWIDPGYQSPSAMLWKLFHKAPARFGLSYTNIWHTKYIFNTGGYLQEVKTYADEFLFRCLALRHGAVYLGSAPVVCVRSSAATFSGQTRNDPGLHAEVMNQAARLMRTRYAELFPERFIRHWEQKVREELGISPMSKRRWAKLAFAWGLRASAAKATRLLGR